MIKSSGSTLFPTLFPDIDKKISVDEFEKFLGTHGSEKLEEISKLLSKTYIEPTPKLIKSGGVIPVSAIPVATTVPAKGHPLDEKVAEAIRNTLLKRGAAAPAAAVAPAAPKEPEIVKKEVKLAAGQKMASEILGVKLAKDADFPVTILDRDRIPPQLVGLIPTTDPDYRVQKEEACKMLRAWEEGDKTMVYGPTGSGKSSLVKYLCSLTERPFIRINLTEDTDSSILFGQQGVEIGKGTVWHDGPITEAVRFGGVLLMDEWELMTAGVSMGMQWLLEDDGHLYLKEMPGSSMDKLIKPHANFRLVYGGNTVGQGDDTGSHAGTNVQNTATIDRFQTVIRMDYLDAEHEKAVVAKKHPTLNKDIIDKMVKVAALVRQANGQGNIALTMSPRTLLNWGKKILTWGDVKVAFTIAFLDKLRDADRKVVTELYNKVFGR